MRITSLPKLTPETEYHFQEQSRPEIQDGSSGNSEIHTSHVAVVVLPSIKKTMALHSIESLGSALRLGNLLWTLIASIDIARREALSTEGALR